MKRLTDWLRRRHLLHTWGQDRTSWFGIRMDRCTVCGHEDMAW